MKKVLVAEDEQAIREFVVINLKRAGYEPYEASNGEEALEIYEREGKDFDVAILDIMTLMKRGAPIELTQVEFQIMEYFFSNPGTALDRSAILKHVWGEAYYGEEKIVDVNIRRLRMKVEDEPSNPKHIVTVWGLGYKWEA